MRFNEFWKINVSNLFLTAIQTQNLLTEYDNNEFYLMSLSLGENKALTNICETATNSEQLNILPNLFIKKYKDRWNKINNSLQVQINAFQNVETIASTRQNALHSENNYDYFGNESNEVTTNDKLNTGDNTLSENISNIKTVNKNIDYNTAMNNFLKVTEISLTDIILNDLIDFLTIDIY